MKLVAPNIKVKKSGDFVEEYFSFGDMSVIMSILRSKLYSDPIKALVQEIMSNARDAHREIGTPERPIQVTVPDSLNLTFCVNDFGLGITPDRMSNIFIRYGCSTKRNNNKQIGGFGIGAKSPFAYTDTFTVETVTQEKRKKIKRIYVAYIDETNIGKMSLVSTQEVTGDTGTKIIVPCKPDDIADFREQVLRVSRFWDIRPEIVGEWTWPKEEKFTKNDSRFWLSTRAFSSDCHILLDGIPYPLNLAVACGQSFIDNFIDNYGKFNLSPPEANAISRLLKHGIVLPFHTGELTITANRENIELNTKNSIRIISRLKQVIKHLLDDLLQEIDKKKNMTEACGVLHSSEFENSVRILSPFCDRIRWKGHVVPLQLVYDRSLSAYEYVWMTKHGKSCLGREKGRSVSILPDTLIVICDVREKIKARILTIMSQANAPKRVFLIDRSWHYGEEFADALQKFINEYPIDIYGIRKLSEFEPTTVKRSYTSTKQETVKGYVRIFQDNGSISKCWRSCSMDELSKMITDDTVVLHCPVDSNRMVLHNILIDYYNMRRLVSFLWKQHKKCIVVGTNTRNIRYVKTSWVLMESYFDNWAKKKMSNKEFAKFIACVAKKTESRYSDQSRNTILNFWSFLQKLKGKNLVGLSDDHVVRIVYRYAIMLNERHEEFDQYITICRTAGCDIPMDMEIWDLFVKCLQQYRLLSHLDTNCNVDAMVEYINAIDGNAMPSNEAMLAV